MDDIVMRDGDEGHDEQQLPPAGTVAGASAGGPPHPPRRSAAPRLYHKKSRTGCLRCKARRVKCDEKRPSCGGCSRHHVDCVYPSQAQVPAAPAPVPASTPAPAPPVQALSAASASLSTHLAAATAGPGPGPSSSLAPRLQPSSDAPIIDTAYAHVDQEQTTSPHEPPPPPPPVHGLGESTSLPNVSSPKPSSLSAASHSSGFSPPASGPYSTAPGLLSASTPAPRFPLWEPYSAVRNYPPSASTPGFSVSTPAPSIGGSSSSSSSYSPNTTVREASDYLSQLTNPDVLDLPESRERRMWELRLLYNYSQIQSQQFYNLRTKGLHGDQPQPGITLHNQDVDPRPPDANNSQGPFVWGREIPVLAFQNDAILYSMLASSALDMLTKVTDPQEEEQLRVFQEKYLAMALREQRHSVANLSRDNADMVCMGAMTILQNSFALVQMLPARPWQPPLEWLRMGKGAGAVLVVSRGYLGFKKAGEERITRLLASTPHMDPDEVFRPKYRAHLEWLLENDRDSTDATGDHELDGIETTWQPTLDIYYKVLSFVGYVQQAIAEKAPIYTIIRRFIGFSMLMPVLYHEFLAQRRARALITLAHFFKLWIPYNDLWLIGKAGENQVRGIYEELPEKWKHKVGCIFEEYNLELEPNSNGRSTVNGVGPDLNPS